MSCEYGLRVPKVYYGQCRAKAHRNAVMAIHGIETQEEKTTLRSILIEDSKERKEKDIEWNEDREKVNGNHQIK